MQAYTLYTLAPFTADDYINFVQAKIESAQKSMEGSPPSVFSTYFFALSTLVAHCAAGCW